MQPYMQAFDASKFTDNSVKHAHPEVQNDFRWAIFNHYKITPGSKEYFQFNTIWGFVWYPNRYMNAQDFANKFHAAFIEYQKNYK